MNKFEAVVSSQSTRHETDFETIKNKLLIHVSALLLTWGPIWIGAPVIKQYLDLKSQKEKVALQIDNMRRDLNRIDVYNEAVSLYGDHFKGSEYTAKLKQLEGLEEKIDEDIRDFDWGTYQPTEYVLEPFNQEKNHSSLGLDNLPSRYSSEREVSLDSVFLEKIFVQTFPKNWVKGEVSSVRYAEKRNEPGYGLSREWELAMQFDRDRGDDEITVYPTTDWYSLDEMIETFSHELGHANDWESDKGTSPEEKLWLAVAVGKRVDAEDRFRSEYVESIWEDDMPKNVSPEEKRYDRAVEYWGEICSIYFTNPSLLPYADFEIVDTWVKKNDPTFDIEKALELRKEIINKHTHK